MLPGMYTVIIKSYGKGKYNSYSVNRVHFFLRKVYSITIELVNLIMMLEFCINKSVK